MWVRILSGNLAGRLRQMPDTEAQNAIATGFARAATPAEYTLFDGQSKQPVPKAELERHAEAVKARDAAAKPVAASPARPPEPLKAMHRQFGKWDVVNQSGHALNAEPLTKDEAAAWATTGKDPRVKA